MEEPSIEIVTKRKQKRAESSVFLSCTFNIAFLSSLLLSNIQEYIELLFMNPIKRIAIHIWIQVVSPGASPGALR
jgi:hypothetical protein